MLSALMLTAKLILYDMLVLLTGAGRPLTHVSHTAVLCRASLLAYAHVRGIHTVLRTGKHDVCSLRMPAGCTDKRTALAMARVQTLLIWLCMCMCMLRFCLHC